ncbi:MAG: GNAT family N-acetyltransferase [Lachnospiraceae bacterium]|nr:GNAT family N-acetyltransferase [Lachnospiraceae bacterium]
MSDLAAAWFHSKWGVPQEAYAECIKNYVNRDTELGWYLALDDDKIVAGLGVIENDFHERKDLTPNICAVFTEEAYRCQGIAGRLLDFVVEDCRKKDISPVYLITDHTSFYERYGWEFLQMVKEEDSSNMTRMYIHK